MSEEKSQEQNQYENLYFFMEKGTGRQLIGLLLEEEGQCVNIKDPLMIMEQVMPPQANNESQRIALNIAPIMHTFNIDTWEFEYAGKHKVVDEKLISTYDKFRTQIRASRSGLTLAKTMPEIGLVKN